MKNYLNFLNKQKIKHIKHSSYFVYDHLGLYLVCPHGEVRKDHLQYSLKEVACDKVCFEA